MGGLIPGQGPGRCLYSAALRMYAYALWHWCRAQGNGRGLGAIAFDKLVTLYSRLWDRLRDRRQVSFAMPFAELHGWHGRGRAIHTDDPPPSAFPGAVGHGLVGNASSPVMYVGEFIYTFDQSFFGRPLHADFTGPPRDPRTRVLPAITGLLADEWRRDPSFLSEAELAVMDALVGIVTRLEEESITALGTHSTAERCSTDLSFEAKNWRRLLLQALKAAAAVAPLDWGTLSTARKHAYDARTCGDEAMRKALANREVYAAARAAATASSPGVALDVFHECQAPASAIWDDGCVTGWAAAACLMGVLAAVVWDSIFLAAPRRPLRRPDKAILRIGGLSRDAARLVSERPARDRAAEAQPTLDLGHPDLDEMAGRLASLLTELPAATHAVGVGGDEGIRRLWNELHSLLENADAPYCWLSEEAARLRTFDRTRRRD